VHPTKVVTKGIPYVLNSMCAHPDSVDQASQTDNRPLIRNPRKTYIEERSLRAFCRCPIDSGVIFKRRFNPTPFLQSLYVITALLATEHRYYTEICTKNKRFGSNVRTSDAGERVRATAKSGKTGGLSLSLISLMIMEKSR